MATAIPVGRTGLFKPASGDSELTPSEVSLAADDGSCLEEPALDWRIAAAKSSFDAKATGTLA
jgi:hypothetical protein